MNRPEKWVLLRKGKVILRSHNYVAMISAWVNDYRPKDELLLADEWRARKRARRMERAAEDQCGLCSEHSFDRDFETEPTLNEHGGFVHMRRAESDSDAEWCACSAQEIRRILAAYRAGEKQPYPDLDTGI